jgi:hypothetical protein
MWALVTKNGAAKPLSHRFAALWEPIWGLCGFIGQSQKVNSRKPAQPRPCAFYMGPATGGLHTPAIYSPCSYSYLTAAKNLSLASSSAC